jgi:hydrolase, HD family
MKIGEKMELIERIKNDLKENLTEYRYIHSLGVMEMAEELATIYNVDVESTRLAGLLHDIAKEMTEEESLKYVAENSIAIDDIEKINVSILHGKIGADIAKKKYGVNEQIQKAIQYHTETNPNMDTLAKIIYVSDKIEKNRKSEKFDLEYERNLAKEDIDAAVLFIIDASIKKVIKKGKLLHPTIVETRNKIIMNKMQQN